MRGFRARKSSESRREGLTGGGWSLLRTDLRPISLLTGKNTGNFRRLAQNSARESFYQAESTGVLAPGTKVKAVRNRELSARYQGIYFPEHEGFGNNNVPPRGRGPRATAPIGSPSRPQRVSRSFPDRHPAGGLVAYILPIRGSWIARSCTQARKKVV